MRNKYIAEEIKQWLAINAGAMIFAVSVSCFTAPNHIAPGGLTGLATALNFLLNIPIGTTVLVLNIPLLIWGIYKLGWRFTARTIIATVIASTAIDVFKIILPTYTENPLLAALFGGVLSGIALALVVNNGATTGGSDLAAKIISKRLRHLSVGRLLFVLDVAIVFVATLIFKNAESGMYALLTIFTSSKVLDQMLYGLTNGNGKMVFIITQKDARIATRIMEELGRGVTKLHSSGAYSKQDNVTLLCAMRNNELYKIRMIVNEEDKNAFLIVGTAEQIVGESFLSLDPEI